MKYEIAKIVMVIAAASIFFALVHPFAADPIGVGKVELLADAMAPAPSLLQAFLFQVTLEPAISPAAPMPLMAVDATELNCVLTI